MKSIVWHRFKNWILENKEWLIVIVGGALLLFLAFQSGYVLGRHELSPITIEKTSK